MQHRALITGIAGFVGGYLAEHLLARGDAVLGCSLDGNWEPSSAPGLVGRVELTAWNMENPDGAEKETRRKIADFLPDCIYHLAAISMPGNAGKREPTAKALAVNVGGTRRVLELAASLRPRPRVLLASSSHVYAPVSFESNTVDEVAPLGPPWAYGRTKLAAEEAVRRAVTKWGVDAVIARAFPHTGPRQNPQMMLPQWARQLALGGEGPLEVHTCDAYLDLTDVRDVVRAYRLLANHGRTGRAYNVGSGVCRRSGDVLEVLQQTAGSRRTVVQLKPGRKADPIADTSRLKQCTGWLPEIPLETTVADTLAWWRLLVETGKVFG